MSAFYLAAAYGRRQELIRYKRQLESLGHTVTSNWLNGDAVTDDGIGPGNLGDDRRLAERDLHDIEASTVLVVFTQPPGEGSPRGGHQFEFGYARGRGLDLIVVGYRTHVFCSLPGVHFYRTWQRALEAIGEGEAKG